MSIAVIGTVHKLASVTVETLVAEARTIAANAVVRAVSNTHLERAVESREALIALASKVGVASTMSRASVRAAAVKAVGSRKARVAATCSLIAPAVAHAVVGAAKQ